MSEKHLSEIAAHLILPENITHTAWPPVQYRLAEMQYPLDVWQQDWLKAILAKRKDGHYAASIDGIQASIPRQVGKTYTIGGLTFALATLYPNYFVLWTAHRTRTADETFNDMKGMAQIPDIAPYVNKIRQANGQQAIMFNNGSRILFGAREGGFGRGFHGVDMILFDEAQILGAAALDDMIPATNTAPDPLIIKIGTPPKPKDPSEAFSEFRNLALQGEIKDGLYLELAADYDANSDDRKQWEKANPSYPRRTPESAILRMRRQLGEESFRREGLGIWDHASDRLAIDPVAWNTTTIRPENTPSGMRWCAAIRFAPDGSTCALARAGHKQNTPTHVELCTHQGVRRMNEGTQWIIDYIADTKDRWAQIIVDGKYGAGDTIERLRAIGVRPQVIITPTITQIIDAYSMLDASLRENTITHLDDMQLRTEAASATPRPIGTSGGWALQAPPGATVAGLEACTLAMWAARTTKRRPRYKPYDKIENANSNNDRGGGVLFL